MVHLAGCFCETGFIMLEGPMTANSDVKPVETTKPLDPAEVQRRVLKLLLELGPLLVFFLVTNLYDIYIGTACFVPLTTASLIASWLLLKRVAMMPLVSGFFVIMFGGLTLYLHDDLFIKMKPTILDGLFSVILFGGLAMGRSWLKYLFEDEIQLTDLGWRILTFRWACFFAFLAVLNEIIWRNTSPAFWSGFKLYGILPLTIVFTLAQLGLLKKYESQSS